MIVLQERAEEYSYEEIEKLEPLHPLFVKQIENYLFSESQRPLVVLAPKGSGKTYACRKALIHYEKSGAEYKPVFLIYKRKRKQQFLEPEKLTRSQAWIEACKSSSSEEILEEANIIVYDDFHYRCEDVLEGTYEISALVDELSMLLKAVGNNKKVILFSNKSLGHYARKIKNEKLDTLLPRFGDWNPEKPETRRNVEYLSAVEIQPVFNLSAWEVVEFFRKLLRVDVDPLLAFGLFHATENPRVLVKFFNSFEDPSSPYSELLPCLYELVDKYASKNKLKRQFLKDKLSFLQELKAEIKFAHEPKRALEYLRRRRHRVEKIEKAINMYERELSRLDASQRESYYFRNILPKLIGRKKDSLSPYVPLFQDLQKGYKHGLRAITEQLELEKFELERKIKKLRLMERRLQDVFDPFKKIVFGIYQELHKEKEI